MDLPGGHFAALAQSCHQQVAIGLINKDGLAPVAAVHDMVNRAWVLHSEFARHPEE